jgi:hypothetical protein
MFNKAIYTLRNRMHPTRIKFAAEMFKVLMTGNTKLAAFWVRGPHTFQTKPLPRFSVRASHVGNEGSNIEKRKQDCSMSHPLF